MDILNRIQHIIPLSLLITSSLLYLLSVPYFFASLVWSVCSLFLPAHVYQGFEDILYYVFQRFVFFFTEVCTGVKLVLHGDVQRVLSKKERVLYICNHQSAVDWVAANMLAARQGSLPHVRYLLKHSLQYVPIFGFITYLHGCIFVNRKNFKSQKMKSSLVYLQSKKIPSWIVIYPEGTRYNLDRPEVLEKSISYAKEQGLMPLKQVLFPKSRGFFMVMNELKGHLDAVYDVTLVYSNTKKDNCSTRFNAPTFSGFCGGSCDTIHLHVNRIGINDVPTSEDEIKLWFYELFKRKNDLLEQYYNSNAIQDTEFGKGLVSPQNIFYNIFIFILFVILTVLLLTYPLGRWFFLGTLILSAIIGYIWKFTDILITQYRTLKKS